MYETMVFWENPPDLAKQPPVIREFAQIWQSAEKFVYSRSLESTPSARTVIVRAFDTEVVRNLKATKDADISVGGAALAAQAIAAGLVDEYQLFFVPVVIGGGKQFLPGGVRTNLELLEERRFRNGTVCLRYGTSAKP